MSDGGIYNQQNKKAKRIWIVMKTQRLQTLNKFTILALLVLIFCLTQVNTFIITPSVNEPMIISPPKQIQPTQPQNCTESYPRLFYTQIPSQMLIRFNTIHPCNRSYVTINQNSAINKYYCNSALLKIQQNSTFIRYIQSCLVNIRVDLLQFNYTVYGQGLNPAVLKNQAGLFKVNIPQKGSDLNLVATADWGPIQVRPYQPIYPSLIRQIQQTQRPLHGLIIIGDVSYDESDRQCQQYELFMSQLSVVSPYLPIIPLSGNHQGRNPLNYQLFRQTFQCYNHTTDERVQTYHFWNFKLVTFDPYLEIYNKSNPQIYQKMRKNILRELQPNQQKNDLTILSSHYPVICSQEVFHCRQQMLVISDLLTQFSNTGVVDLYLGAHMHQYERVVSYQNGVFIEDRKGPYGRGEMPSIVEGVGGCDLGIISQEYPVEKFSVAHTYAKTGYGFLIISNLTGQPKLQYLHKITPSSTETLVYDSVIIDPSIPKPSKSQIIKEQ